MHLSNALSGQNFVVEFPNLDRGAVPYMHHFITFCSRFLAYSNDNEGNPFQQDLVPMANSSPALLHSMTAVAASHLSRSQPQHSLTAATSYAMALRELNAVLSDPVRARSDSTLGACLLLCVFEVRRPWALGMKAIWLMRTLRYASLIILCGLSIFKGHET